MVGKVSTLILLSPPIYGICSIGERINFVYCLELAILVQWEDKPFHSEPEVQVYQKSQWVKVG